MSKQFYVYELINPVDNMPFYVGKGTIHKLEHYAGRRLSEHLKECRYYTVGRIKSTYKIQKILSIQQLGFQPIIKIIMQTTVEQEAFQKEIELIAHYGRKDIKTGFLTNHTNGGEGMSGYKHSKEHLQRLRENNHGGKATAIPVAQICPNTGVVIKIWESARQAGISLTDNIEAKSNINASCRRYKNRTSYGFYWRFTDDLDIDVQTLNSNRDISNNGAKRLQQLDLDGNVIKIWKSASDACRFYNLHVSSLTLKIKHNKVSQNSYWRYI